MTHHTTTQQASTLFINGAWVPSQSGETRLTSCPADGSEVGVVSKLGKRTPWQRSLPPGRHSNPECGLTLRPASGATSC